MGIEIRTRRPMLFLVEGRILQEDVVWQDGFPMTIEPVDVTHEVAKAISPLDDPVLDSTNSAHSAWWRGIDCGIDQCLEAVAKTLDGTDDGTGVAPEPWESIRRRLLDLRNKNGNNER